ncbi:hypothetical protein A2291_06095 [candidate division WOR-1 bacterium RIFOXYB2_FULL_42_35]|uniref:Uncharacterized protein n=1 Tax=candidate division WOR-1 bacterium RIFOXYC2_FULL_41_25 TaxID=1802586 RepID=A0A1F4TJP2_UNCSA|nr:MAG: hypothetical protein A2247_01755 [candidate division WOR-1 bacterium RIFOXYA2_FULL_41_14]OGC22295.1 MAG: hypothetical protein A2291_06095 [candidate division WOR-1 bacterium RIFOXYB2_FULL_42_35]OGC32914.1 MAG: hypothetical protein A2462_00770 [candidate division WOR-1 bacterium RIFOXYC2_FULL_41_25]OGC41721.1 MAG: hypothetical protein A2548_05010 [candidate division WOR-1 bacterium RIFOXYD2_FULL_41_8]
MDDAINLPVDQVKNELSLLLTVKDNDVIKYLNQFEDPLRADKALEALKVGVIAILSASPTLDTKIVEDKFNIIEKKLEDYTDEFKNNLKEDLKKYFEKEKGDVPTALNALLGEKGSLSLELSKYFNIENGKVNQLLKQELGPASNFAKSIDPLNKESVISKIEDKVKDELTKMSEELKSQFSLDKNDSSISKVRKMFEDKVEEIKKGNNNFFSEIRMHFGMKEIQAEEAEKGTQKGRDFESALYERVASLGLQLADSTENVTGSIGNIQRSKIGDYVITLGDTSGAPGKRIVIEVKNAQNYSLRKAIEELKEAKDNRSADCGIFVFAKGCEPVEMGDFRIDGDDYYCTVDEAMLEQACPVVFLEAAYKISRVNIIAHLRKNESGEINLVAVKGNIKKMLDQVSLMSDLLTKAKTIQASGEKIEEAAKSIKEELESVINSTLALFK